MEYIRESLQTPVAGHYDVIVAGGGPAGCAAAIAAGRAGMKTLLIEKHAALGGMWTSGLVNPVFDAENKGGIMREIIDALNEKNAWGGFWKRSFHYEYMKKLLDDLCREAGVTVLFDTRYSGAIVENGAVKGVIVQNIEGRLAYLSDVTIDATADACVAADCGVPCRIGEEDYTTCQAMTLMFLIGNIPEKHRDGLMLYDALSAAYEKEGKGKKPPYTRPWIIPIPNADYAVVQLTHMRGVDPLDAHSLSEALAEGRRQMLDVFEALKTYDPEFADLTLLYSAPMLGVRESRRIEGEYTLDTDDLLEGRMPKDSVTTAAFNIDIHEPNAIGQQNRQVKPYGIPYRCMLPKGVENLLVAGRSISGTHVAMASYRVTADCAAMGEAAGKAAAYAVKTGKTVRNISPKEFLV